ncbi:transposase [Geomonas anaerohicana]|uniref:transposase n=1 Tax=Geomonas anaerohicana TaxID=2798583 RepID=UPI001F2155A0|nr:transposase [Geomonas anaerohicana]
MPSTTHVTSRGNARADIFLEDADRRTVLKTLASVVLRYNWICHAYCLMGNHYHLIIETPEANLSQGMRQLNGTYTQTFNKMHGRVGHIFQGRFRAIVVQQDSHLLELSRYVVLNPVRAGIVAAPEEWPWSSYRSTQGVSNHESFLNSHWLLGQFGSTMYEAKKHYRYFVLEGARQNISPWQRLIGEVVFGTEEFAAGIHALIGEGEEITEIPRSQRHVGRPMLEALFPQETLASRSKRNAAIGQAHLEHGYELKEIAHQLGMHYTSVSKIIKKLLDKR